MIHSSEHLSYKRPWFILQTVVAPTTLKPLSSDWPSKVFNNRELGLLCRNVCAYSPEP